MGKRYPHDPASAQAAPNGSITYRSYRGAPGALIQACPIDGHAGRLSVYATDRQGATGCTRIRGVHVPGRITWGADGPRFTPTGLPDSAGAKGAPGGSDQGLPSVAPRQTRPASVDCSAGGGPAHPARRSQGVSWEISPRQS